MSLECALLLACPSRHRARARFVFRAWASRYDVSIRFIERTGDAPEGRHLIIYGDADSSPRPHLRIPCHPALADEPPDPARARWTDYRGRPLLDLQGDAQAPMAEKGPNAGTVLGMDIVSASFGLLSGSSERGVNRFDQHRRIPHDQTLVGRLGIVHRAVVDDWFSLLADGLAGLAGVPVRRRDLWRGAPFAVCLTHDIDRIHRGWVDASRRAVRHAIAGRWAAAVTTARQVLRQFGRGADFYWNLDDVARLDARYGGRSTFFLMAGAEHPLDADYRLAGSRWKDAVRRIGAAGGEIGLHGSYRSYRDGAALRREREIVERLTGEPVAGVRQHFLRFDPMRTWRAQADAGFRYDASVGFVEQVGFRAGTAFPYQAYDVESDRALPLVEVPLVAMDRTLEGYLKLSPRDAWNALEPVLRTVERSGGCLGLLWHNLFVVEACFPGWRALYERILDWARSRGAWITTAGQASLPFG